MNWITKGILVVVTLITIIVIDTKPIPAEVEYFKPGQILLPDYACIDTLIVRDAKGLNKAMALFEQGIIDGTDNEIDSVFHSHCDYFIGSFEDQYNKLKILCPTWDSLQIVTAINED